MDTETIHVVLVDEPIWVARPVLGQKIRPFVYKIVSTDYDPETETWEFLPGTIVRCETRENSGSEYLLAVEALAE